MDTAFISTLSEELDPELEWGIKTTDIVKIANRKTGKDYCTHQFPEKTIAQWLERKYSDENLCYLCQGNDKTAMRLRFENLTISANDKRRKVEKEGKEEVEDVVVIPPETRSIPPLFIQKAIIREYDPVNHPLPKELEIAKSDFDFGIFAKQDRKGKLLEVRKFPDF